MAGRPLRATLVTPLSGPLGRYGRAGAIALELWADQAGVELEIADTQPSAAAAVAAVASGRPIDVLFGPYGAGPAVAAARAAPSALWNHGGATVRLARPTFPHVVNVPAPALTYLAAVIDALGADITGGHAVLLHSTAGFGHEVADGARRAASGVGLPVTAVAFEPGTGEAAARRAEAADADVLLVAGGVDDEVAIASRLLGPRWRIAAFVAAGVDEILQPLGARLTGVYGPCQWLPESAPQPDEGPDAGWFTAAYARLAGSSPPYPAAAAFAAAVLWERCVRDAGSAEPNEVVAAAHELDTTTLFGRFSLDPVTGLQAGHRVGVVQWHGGRRVVVTEPR